MLKGLVILGGGALIVAAILVAVYYQQRNAIGQGYDIICTHPSEPTAASAPLACKIYPSQNTDQDKPKPPWWNVLIAWPDGITAWLLLLTLGAIAWQTWETSEAAKGAKRAADAALMQAKHMFMAQRPWISVSCSDDTVGKSSDGKWLQKELVFIARNKGKSPAKVTMYMAEKNCIDPKDTDEGPKFSADGRFDEAQWRFPKGYFTIGRFTLEEDFVSQAKQTGKFVLFQGFVRYEDTLSYDMHETRFCYQAFIENDRFGFRMYKAKGYNTMT